ncbi:hypothetical protein ABZZ17_03625 [Streptomyces sp. NPDC006512]|uniref:hypothetical protein n=1 Tax=Streptomyces sp. NPDC006512 TaxID=3154307 RepID=UPI0033A6A4F2
MDVWEGTAVLEWWANRSTCLGAFGLRIRVSASDALWACDAVLDPPLSEDDQEVFDFLMDLDPVFTLRFDEASSLTVHVVAGEDAALALTAYEPEARP